MSPRFMKLVLMTLALSLAAGVTGAEESSATRPFWAEFEGTVEIDSTGPNGPIILVRADNGLPLFIDTDGIQEWGRREGRHVEIEGYIRDTPVGAVMEVIELSHEKGSWGSRSPISLEGYVSEVNGQPTLETRNGGSVPLVIVSRHVRPNRRVEIDGMLVRTEDGVAIEVHDIDYD